MASTHVGVHVSGAKSERVRGAPVFLLPLPHGLEELLAAEVVARDALLSEQLLHRCLGRNAGVVSAGHPQCLEATHAVPDAGERLARSAHSDGHVPPDECVLDRVGQGVSDVQSAGYVRGRDHDDVLGLIALRVGGKEALDESCERRVTASASAAPSPSTSRTRPPRPPRDRMRSAAEKCL